MSGAEAACSVHGSPSGWLDQSDLFDFHELRREFIPPNTAKRANSQAETTTLKEKIVQVIYQMDMVTKKEHEQEIEQ